ncbi:site-specific integrase [Salmonella enterica subsp. enterica]|nr:site-specific integrase [Salmonella enterica subsp. enterica serovar Belfast]EFR2313550.1 site-specific integrase [Salmonella enterica]EGC2275111.1 site-specific integrase [Salmonella enterica subsp. enterica serovar Agbeni]EDX9681377.1 site-specific integrase [Salmonella enterica subsp. enterica serovar Belfast]EDY5456689.1 site-specific integrase [Salmonella enterica subsp. enterica serovar Belfast]
MAAENKLSDKQLKSLVGKPQAKQKVISDGRGMSVRVSKNGGVSFVFFYRMGGRDTAPVWLTLGKYPDLSLKMAREKRDECRTWLAEGIDPRHRIGLITDESQRPVTVKDALEYWIEYYAKPKRRTWLICEQRFVRYIYSRIGDIPLALCTAAVWVKCFDEIKKTAPVAAGHTFRDVKQALKFCRVRRYATSNELEDFTVMDMGERAKKRDRVLTADEIRDVWYWANVEEGNIKFSPNNRIVLIILTVFGCRGRELRKSTWEEWDFENWVWTVPKEHSKNGREIIRPIPPQIRQWLVNLRAIAEEEKTERLLNGEFSKQTVMSTVGSRFYRKFKHEKPWSLHDLRRVLATNLNDMGVDPHVVEQLLGHTLPGVMGIYNRSQYMSAKLDALTRWVDYLNELIKPMAERAA